MKPFLACDVTEDRDNEKYNGEEFIVARPSEANAKALEENFDKTFDMAFNKTFKEKIADIIKAICCLGTIFPTLLTIAVVTKTEVTLKEIYQNTPWAFYLVGAMAIIWGILEIISKKNEKAKEESDESKQLDRDRETISRNIFVEMNVPLDLPDTELISFQYTTESGSAEVYKSKDEITPFNNFTMKLYVANCKLYIADLEGKYEIDLASLLRIKTVNKRITLPIWYKDTPHSEGEYKRFNIREEIHGMISFKPYHVLEFEHCGETWGIYFPCYELDTIEKLTGLKAED